MTTDSITTLGSSESRFSGVSLAKPRADISAAVAACLNWVDGDDAVAINADELKEIVSNRPIRAHLLLPAKHALIQTVSLPLTAQKHLADILENKIRQLTPFEPKDVFYGYERIGGRTKELTVKIVVAPKKACLTYLNTARDHQISVDRLEVNGAAGINILPADERDAARSASTTNRLIKLNGILLIALLALILLGGGLRYAFASAQASKAASSVTEVLQARREVLKISTASQELQTLQASAPDITAILNSLAQSIDETAWLDQVTINNNTIEIQGYAETAADVLFAVDQLPEISDAAFKSAISRDKTSGKERFQIRANLASKS